MSRITSFYPLKISVIGEYSSVSFPVNALKFISAQGMDITFDKHRNNEILLQSKKEYDSTILSPSIY